MTDQSGPGAADDRGDGWDGDRLVRLAVVGLALVVIAGVTLLAGLAATGTTGSADPAEDVRWRLEPVNDTHALVVHDGGPTVAASVLTVTVDGLERDVRWSDPTLSAGDAGLVRVEGGSRLTLHAHRSRSDGTVLVRFDLE